MTLTEAFEDWRRQRDAASRLRLLEAAQHPVYNLCAQVLGNPHDAEDAAQNVLLDLAAALPRLNDAEHCRRWLHRAALHSALNAKRGRKTRMEYEERKARRDAAAAASGDELADAVHEQLATLDDDLRSLIVEHYFERKTLEEMARERGVSSVAVWKNLEKARERMKRALSGALMACFDPFLTSRVPVAAPPGLITPAIAAKAAAVSVLAGGILVKVIVAAVVLAVSAGGVVLVGINRSRAEEQVAVAQAARAKVPKVPATVPVTATPTTIAAAPPAEPVVTFATAMDYALALQKAVLIDRDPDRWTALRKLGFALTDDEFLKALDAVRARRGTRDFFGEMLTQLVTVWADRDPALAATYARSLPRPEEGAPMMDLVHGFLDLILTRWRLRDETAALKFAETLPPGRSRNRLVRHLEAQGRPAALSTTILSLPMDGDREEALGWLAASWNPEEALGWAASLSKGAEKESFVGRVLGRLHFDTAMGRFKALPPEEQTDSALLRFLEAAAPTNGAAAMEAACARFNTSDPKNYLSVSTIALAWAKSDPGAAVRWTLAMPPTAQVRQVQLESLAGGWAQADPAKALDWALSVEAGADRDRVLKAVLQGAARSPRFDPKSALAVLEKLPPASRPPLIQGVISGWADFDPVAAAEFAKSQPTENVPLALLVQRLTERDADAALAWSAALPDPKLRDEARKNVVMTTTGIDVPKALRLAEGIADPAVQADAYRWIASTGSRRDLATAIEALKRISEPRFSEVAQLASQWVLKDPDAAMAWVLKLPKKDNLSDSALQTTLVSWGRKDSDAACRWVDQSALPDDQKRQLVKSIRLNRR